jgi:isopenicillin N synthase-like dioxygenase
MTPADPRRPSLDEIPIIDIAPLRQASALDLKDVASRLGRACEDVGFFYIVNHGVPEDVIDRAFEASVRFHAQALAEKQRLSINEFHRGYIGARSYALDSALKPNLSESWVMMHEVPDNDPRFGRPLQGPNQWPSLDGWKGRILEYHDALAAVGQALLPAFAAALDLPQTYFTDMFVRPTTFLRLLHYPPQPPDSPENQFGSAPHTDYGCITILNQDEVGGLHVRTRRGEWIAAPPIAGTFVVNLGDVMARWTNDRFVSTPHRVINRSGRERYSIPFFFDPDMDAVIECLSTCTRPGESPKYDPITYGEYLLGRLNAHYAYRKAGAADV